jgi:hypothetical protein
MEPYELRPIINEGVRQHASYSLYINGEYYGKFIGGCLLFAGKPQDVISINLMRFLVAQYYKDMRSDIHGS